MGIPIYTGQSSDLVNLEVGHSDQVLLIMGLGNVGEDVVEGVGNEPLFLGVSSLSSHGVRLPRARLTIGKHRTCNQSQSHLFPEGGGGDIHHCIPGERPPR